MAKVVPIIYDTGGNITVHLARLSNSMIVVLCMGLVMLVRPRVHPSTVLPLTGIYVDLRKEKKILSPCQPLTIFCLKTYWLRDLPQLFVFHNYQQTNSLWVSCLPFEDIYVFGFSTILRQWVPQFVLSEKCFLLFVLNQVCNKCMKCPPVLVLWEESE